MRIEHAAAVSAHHPLLIGGCVLALLFAWWKLLHWKAHPALRLLLGAIALFPLVGPVLCLWVMSIPEPAPQELRGRGRGGFMNVPAQMQQRISELEAQLAEAERKEKQPPQ